MDSNMKSVLRNYLSNCGDGRGLEKFLRRNSFSSDGETSIRGTPITTRSRKKTKSLENLCDRSRAKSSSKSPKTPPKEKQQANEENKSEEKPKSMDQAPKVVVKQTGEKFDRKNSKFNYESVIEITLPPPPTANVPQLSQIADKSTIEEPIKPVISTPLKPKIPSHTNKANMSPISTHESLVSNKQNPMEWDSFIPGFESSAQQSFIPMELGDSELNGLKTYFQKIGLQLPNENLVVVIKNKPDPARERDRQLSEIKRNKEKWQNIYEKYKEKYCHSRIDFDSACAQSTPKVPEATMTSRVIEKGSQTSLVRNTAKGTQVEVPSIHRSSKECQVTVDRGTLSSKHSQEVPEIYQNQSEVAESFEFIAGSMNKQRNESPVSVESKRENSEAASEISAKNEDISNFDDSLKVAIALLNSLLESRHMKPELKRNLAGKVIQKIVQIQTSRSIQTSTLGSSGVYPLSNSSRAPSEVAKEQSVKDSSSGKSREVVLKDCLKPMTKSEQSYQNSMDEELSKASVNTKSVPKSQLMDYVKREKKSHLKWIEKEIEHLKNLRDLLKRNETPITLDENLPIYENLSSMMSDKENSKKSEKVSTEMPPPPPPPPLPPPPSTNVWNSHANTRKSSKSRSKLKTPDPPNPDESLATFIDNKNRKFIEKYEKNQKKTYEEANIYTRPYSGNPRNTVEAQRVIKSKSSNRRTSTKEVQTSTSLASSSVFESSDSMSVPVNSNSKSSTTHHSESFGSKERKSTMKQRIAETQTTDSICRTRPIFEANEKNCGTTSTTVTQRINRNKNDKQLQTNPPSIKYTLTFDKKSRANMRQYMSLPQKGNSEYALVSKSSKDIYNQISYSATIDYRRSSENKENYDVDTLIDEEDDDEDFDLQSCLNQKRPDIFSRFEERKRCIAELKKLRVLRNEHRKKLLLLTSEKSLEGKLFSNLPELPLKTKRIFSTKALKLQTQKTVQNLTEVKQKKKEENLKNLKRKNRLMTEIFNKNLQRNVLRGNLNLSNTVNLISK